MIIKGSSRAGPSQLARHLQRADTNERVEIVEVRWGHPDLNEALHDWQSMAAATRGSKGLYHANIDPAANYTMTAEQWAKSVDVLENELGLQGQPRAVVLHEKHGRQHIHVVWARTDIDTMTMRTDSNNYAAHERASLALEKEFGHEHVPGKHEKRDRDRQQEPPRATVGHDEWQQAERTGIDPRVRKAQITNLYEQSDTGQAFKASLEDAGYILAQGDRRDFVLVDEHGEIHSLGRQIKGVKAKDLRAFMASVPAVQLPTAAEAIAAQAERAAPAIEMPPIAPQAAPSPELPPIDDQLPPALEAALREALAPHYAEELANLQARQADEAQEMEQAAADAPEEEAAASEEEENAERAPLLSRLWQRVREILSPEIRRAREADEQRRQAAKKAHLEHERQARRTEEGRRLAAAREFMKSRHAGERADLAAAQEKDLTRRVAEERDARRIALEIERQRQQQLELGRGPPRAG